MTNIYSPLFILSFSLFTVSGQSITISGTTTLVTPTSELKITCQPSSAGIDDINSISIQKNSSTSDYITLVTVSYSKTSASSIVSWANTVLQNRQGVSATGNVDSKSGARLELTITQNNTRCEDGGAYRCNMGVTLTGGSGGVADAEKYVTATVEPTYTNSMTVSPAPNVDGLYYSLGTILTFNCFGTVGSDKREHTWCYKRSTDATFTGYPDNAQNPSINQNNDGLTASGCNFIRSSTLTYNVTAADTSTTFMCEPYTGSFCGGSAANLKASLTIKNLVPGQSITISGTTTLVTPTSELKITCQPSSAGVSDINIISIGKNSSTSDYTTLVSVAYDKVSSSSVISWSNTVLQNRQGVSASGNVNSVSGARLELTITKNNTRCEDGGAYRCNMGVTVAGGSGGVASDEKYVTATVEPTYTNSMTVSPTPNVDGIYYSLGTMLTFNCYGTVGSAKRKHTWCYKRSTDATFTGYPDNAQNPSINQNNDGLTASGCNFIRSSTLTYNVTAADTSTTFMCEPYTGSFCGGSSANLKTELTIKNYVPEITTTTSRCVQCTCTGGVIPWIAVAVVFIIISIALFIVVVYLCQQVGKYKERLRERVEYQGINTGFSKRDEHVYSTTDNYEIPQI